MKKLRPTKDERVKFLKDLEEQLEKYKDSLEDLNIKDLLKECSKIPNDVKKPTISIAADAYLKMLELVNQSPVECSWHGLVERFGNSYLVYDVLVFPQINSATSTTTDEKDFAEWQTNLIMDPKFPIERLRLHGHSHVNMNVFSSGIDDKYQKDLLTKVDNGDYYIFFIMNKKMEMCVFLYDFEQQVMFDKDDITIELLSTSGDIRKWAKEQLKENATTSRPIQSKPYKQESFDDYSYSYFGNTRPIFKGANK